MNDQLLLVAVKTDLGISTTVYDDRLRSCIRTAQERIAQEGVQLNESEGDQNLVIMYAAYLWRCRSSGEGIPRMLRYALNNRIFSAKARADA